MRSSDTTSSPPRPPEEDSLVSISPVSFHHPVVVRCGRCGEKRDRAPWTYLLYAQSTNVDNTVSAKPTPAPARMHARPPLAPVPMPPPNVLLRTPGPARSTRPISAGAKGTPVPAAYKNSPAPLHKASYAPGKPSPLVPKTPAPHRGGAPKPDHAEKSGKTMFSRIATDCSDEIQDFEEKSRKMSPISSLSASPTDHSHAKATSLGKRAKPSDIVSPTGAHQHGRHAKRPVCMQPACSLFLLNRSLHCSGQEAVRTCTQVLFRKGLPRLV